MESTIIKSLSDLISVILFPTIPKSIYLKSSIWSTPKLSAKQRKEYALSLNSSPHTADVTILIDDLLFFLAKTNPLIFFTTLKNSSLLSVTWG